MKHDDKLCPCGKGIDKLTYIAAKHKANTYHGIFHRALQREKSATAQISTLKSEFRKKLTLTSQKLRAKSYAEIRELKEKNKELEKKLELANGQIAQLKKFAFGKKSETSKSSRVKTARYLKQGGKRRGQQPGTKGHGRKKVDLPETTEIIDLPEFEKCCTSCHLPYAPMNTSQDSEVVEISVKAYKRVIKRQKYLRHPHCKCLRSPQIKTAPKPPKCIKKGKLGASVYANLLVGKYGYQIPTYRLIQLYKQYGIPLSQGTVTDGFKTLMTWLTPIYQEMIDFSHKSKHWHVDETGWKVYRKIKNKKNYNWYLWVYCNDNSAIYVLNPSRGMKVPHDFFKHISGGWISSDRYLVYPKVATKHRLVNAYCWVHVRRDFINLYAGFPKLKSWSLKWIDEINQLFGINKKRVKAYKNNDPHWEFQLEIEDKVEELRKMYRTQLDKPNLHEQAKKVLVRLKKFWHGLTTFVGMPEIPMSNNAAETALRGPVVGRKNYYGSGSLWSAELAAMMFTIIETLKKWNVNPTEWLTSYFQKCAKYGTKHPPWWVVNDSLPWDIPDPGFRDIFEDIPVKLPKFQL